jgi:anhydro-N-acetylmuramic acid kinase
MTTMSGVTIEIERGAVRAIGLMSGTSHDGVSAAVVEIDGRRRPRARRLAFRTWPYPARLRKRMLDAAADKPVGAAALSALNFELGEAFARAAVAVARDAKVATSKIAFIGSHGHTFFHLPPRRARRGETASTLQLGESAVIAAATGIPVVADFRPMDIAVGGEGAPLAPLAHQWLFADARRGRVVQNIGGIGNATYIPPRAQPGNPDLIAFDTGPGGMLIDAAVDQQSRGRMRMDRGGMRARRGRVHGAMLAELLRHPYFARRPPKSTGREEFGAQYFARVMRAARHHGVRGDDLVATLTALTARSIADAVRRFIVPRGRVDQLIATGGGARNPALLAMIQAGLPEVEVMTSEQVGIDGDSLEAVAFAILGYQMLRGQPGNIPTVTGARAPAILGKLTLPPMPRKRARR